MPGPVRFAILPLILCAGIAHANGAACENGLVAVKDAPEALSARICAAADLAISLFAECGLSLAAPVEVSLRDSIDPPCFGLFHCGERRIELLTPEAMAEGLRGESVFAHVPPLRFFDSVVVHELAHALYDQVDCPFASCMATAEYMAYGYQIDSLTPQDRAPIAGAEGADEPVPRDMINPFIVMMAPDRFATAAWHHLQQREDVCAWRQGIMSGAILFDHENP
ncbi:hypothetical protein SAMN05421759_10351 [Roseivivax lentus]|uniref:Uncharacterized protein n=1 Tax=Roseivivax lentus TaxID=633194 RepID=A0A1N7LPV4_9RHOB|nr:DUF6639 family protein [Roseivivax lentus]SIS75877.1 hypothetical protein SAMN05421759_10351 [Roseivivax lentus]